MSQSRMFNELFMTTQCHQFPSILVLAVKNPLIAAKKQFKLTPIKTSEMLLVAYLVVTRVPCLKKRDVDQLIHCS